MFIRIVQISSLATTCIGQTLLTFWSHTEQSSMFALIVADLKIPILFCVSAAYDKFDRDCSLSYAQCQCSPC